MSGSTNNLSWALVLILCGVAAFYTAQVQSFRGDLLPAPENLELTSGQKVTVIKIVDGDELSVRVGNLQFVVRILGISSYDPAVNDRLTENVAKEAVRYLEKVTLNNEVELIFEKFARDRYGRVLSYVYKNGVDLGLDLVTNGHSLVFTRYPFPRMPEYLTAERQASEARRGVWALPATRHRSLQLKQVWKNEREREAEQRARAAGGAEQ